MLTFMQESYQFVWPLLNPNPRIGRGIKLLGTLTLTFDMKPLFDLIQGSFAARVHKETRVMIPR